MKKIIVTLPVIFFWIISMAQLPVKQWDASFGCLNTDQIFSLQQTTDGGYILGGQSKSLKGCNKSGAQVGKMDYWIVKTNSNGIKIYDKVFGGSLNDELTVIIQTADGGFIVGGYSESGITGDKTQATYGGDDFWIVKTDATGSKLWDKDFGGTEGDKLISIQETADGGYILGGYSKSGMSGDKTQSSHGENDFWIVKIDMSGAKQWDASFGGNGDDKLSSIEQTSDGGYLLAGFSNSGISGDKSQPIVGKDDYWIVKTDVNGVKQWDKTFGGVGTDELEKAIQTSDGGYLLAGNSDSGTSGDKSQPTQGGFDYWILKTNANGLKQWDTRFGGSADDLMRDAIITSDGRYVLAGASYSSISGDKTQESRNESSSNRSDYWMVKVDTNGGKQYDLRFGSAAFDECWAIDQTTDGGFILGGFTTATSESADVADFGYGEEDFWILKTDAGGSGKYIVTPTITPVSYLPGDSIIIPFEGSGTFEEGNIFTAQLSDINGDFSSPTNLASVASTMFGNLHAIIPVSVPYSGEYRVRVVSSDNSAISFENVEDISIRNFKAVSKEWDKTDVAGLDHLRDVDVTIDNGYLAGGFTYTGVNGDFYGGSDYWIIKLDSTGERQWAADFGGTENDYLRSVVSTNDGGTLIAGTSDSPISGNKSAPKKGESDYWFIKTDANGLKEWDKTFGGGGDDGLQVVVKTSDGGFAFAGSSESGANGDKSQGSQGESDYWIIKTDQNGNKIWDKRFGGPADDFLRSMEQTSDNGFILAGTSYSGLGGDKSEASFGMQDYWLVKIDSTGIKQWDRTFGGSDEDLLYSVIQSSDGGYIAGGNSESGISGSKSEENWGGDDYWVIKTDAEGNKMWDHRYGGKGMEASICCSGTPERSGSLCETPDGGVIIACSSGSGISGDRTQPSRGADDYWLMRIDLNGSRLWDARFGGNADEELMSLKQTSDGGFVVAGNSSSDISGDKTQDTGSSFWIVKTDDGFLNEALCPIPTGLFKSNIKSTSAKVNWNVVPTAQTYSVRYRKTGTVPWTKTTAQLNYKKLTGLLPNTQYDWAVKSVCDQGSLSSDWSETQTFTTKPLRLENDVEEIAFNVFPNPSAGVFTVELTVNDEETMQTKFEVLNIFGQVIYSEDGEMENGRLVKEIEMGNAPDGIYLLRLFINGQVYTSQISMHR
ncbi:MAG: T9SS type A sorting domain-containing protein [Bacteroidetes bacterium]|nr:T9SS type A sorting domain-containing protein [Bacteroidota bacterium]